MVSTATKVGNFTFDNCLMNAAGVYCMTKEELAEVEASAAGSFVTKTGTLEARPGNPEPRYVNVPLGSINSMGLPNNGFEYYLDYVIELQNQPNTKNHFLSLVGLSPEETHTILKKVQKSDYEDSLNSTSHVLTFQANLKLLTILKPQPISLLKSSLTLRNLLA